ncbi:hypothetical protein Hamer_G021670, partial [Homarus americanus]
AWDDINVETVIKSFKKCGISNSMDGMEDDMLWEDEDETEAEATSSDLEFDPYDEAAINVSQDVLEELMISDVDDVDFEECKVFQMFTFPSQHDQRVWGFLVFISTLSEHPPTTVIQGVYQSQVTQGFTVPVAH